MGHENLTILMGGHINRVESNLMTGVMNDTS